MITIKNIREVYPSAAGHKGGGASKLAAEKITLKLNDLHQLVIKALRFFPDGATADELSSFVERHRDSVKPRLSELKAYGLVEKMGKMGETTHGQPCHKWKLISKKERK